MSDPDFHSCIKCFSSEVMEDDDDSSGSAEEIKELTS